jgi:hypothetical protein
MTPAQIAASLAKLSDDDLRKALRTLPRPAIEQLINELRHQEAPTASRLIGLLEQEHLADVYVKAHESFMAEVRPVAEALVRTALADCKGWEPALVAVAVAKLAIADALKSEVAPDLARSVIERVNTILRHCEVHTFDTPEELHTRLEPKTKVEA